MPYTGTKKDSLVKYARRFKISREGDAYFVTIYGNRHDSNYSKSFALCNDTAGKRLLYRFRDSEIIKIPCQKIAALSSIYANMFYELGALPQLIAIDNIDYIVNPAIISRHKAGDLAEIGKTAQTDVEAALSLKPDIIFTFGMGEGDKDRDKKLELTGIPVAISVDHLEESPLARAEWIKFFALFADKYSQADSLFRQVEKKYLDLQALAKQSHRRPTVFTEIKYSEFWYMPGGKSYVATLLNDAGADYLWKDNSDVGSLPLSFEQVYSRAREADYWLHLSTCRSKQNLLQTEKRFADFKAFKTGNLFNNTKKVNEKGYSTYWETGMIFPDRILNDLLFIFHPHLKDSLNSNLYYYEQLR